MMSSTTQMNKSNRSSPPIRHMSVKPALWVFQCWAQDVYSLLPKKFYGKTQSPTSQRAGNKSLEWTLDGITRLRQLVSYGIRPTTSFMLYLHTDNRKLFHLYMPQLSSLGVS